MKSYIISISILLAILLSACNDDFLQLDPSDKTTDQVLLKSEAGVEQAINGIYNKIGSTDSWALYQTFIPYCQEVRGDNLAVLSQGTQMWRGLYNYTQGIADNTVSYYIWAGGYSAIDACNLIINNELEGITVPEDREDYKAQAYAIRAMLYLDLVSFYGKPVHMGGGNNPGVPLVLENDYGAMPKRNTVTEVYEQILKDLTTAEKLIHTASNPLKANKALIHGLYARYFLDLHDYTQAMVHAEKALEIVPIMAGEEVASGYSRITSESMFTLLNTLGDFSSDYTYTTWWDSESSRGNTFRIYQEVVDLFSDTDIRKDFFNADNENENLYFLYNKFPRLDGTTIGYGHYTYMRASEMKLIVAECAARLDQLNKAWDALFEIQSRVDKNAVKSTLAGDDLIAQVLEEKRKELLGEGLRMRDLLRLGETIKRPAGSDALKNAIDIDEDKLQLPIPEGETKYNPNVEQNPGYGN